MNFDTLAIKYQITERFTEGWVDPRGLNPTPVREPGVMSVGYCNHYQRDTPHENGICIYHRNGECRGPA